MLLILSARSRPESDTWLRGLVCLFPPSDMTCSSAFSAADQSILFSNPRLHVPLNGYLFTSVIISPRAIFTARIMRRESVLSRRRPHIDLASDAVRLYYLTWAQDGKIAVLEANPMM